MGKLSHRLAYGWIAVALLTGCREDFSIGTRSPALQSVPPVAKDNTVCDPLSSSPSGGSKGSRAGIRAMISMANVSDTVKPQCGGAGAKLCVTSDYFTEAGAGPDATILPYNLFFSRIHVPTAAFVNGFITENAEAIKNAKGEVLQEWFGIQFIGKIANLPAGTYQFATLSDDGAVVDFDLDEDGIYEKRVVQNDGGQPTSMGCSVPIAAGSGTREVIQVVVAEGQKIPFRLRYFQGPRWHIALSFLARKIENGQVFDSSSAAIGTSALCHAFESNEKWFDFGGCTSANFQQCVSRACDPFASAKEGCSTTSAYNMLVGVRNASGVIEGGYGWKVLGSDNFELPDSSEDNPCLKGKRRS